MRFSWTDEGYPEAAAEDESEVMLARFLSDEIINFDDKGRAVLEALAAAPQKDWIGNEMRAGRAQGGIVISHQYDEEAAPQTVAPALFRDALLAWDDFVREEDVDAERRFPQPAG